MSRVSVAMHNCDIGEEERKNGSDRVAQFGRTKREEQNAGWKPALQKLFGGIQLAVLTAVVEGDVAVGAFLAKVDLARVKRFRVNVDADGALVEFGEIQNLLDKLERADINGVSGIHFVDSCRGNAARAA